MDRFFPNHYAVSMGRTVTPITQKCSTRHAIIVLLWLAVFCLPASVAAAPVIMVLEHIDDGQRVQTEVEAKFDHVISPHAGRGRPKWKILPGEAIESKRRPQDRTVHLFRLVGLQHTRVCIINVRYFKNKKGAWVPHFLLNQEPLLIKEGKRWKPLTKFAGIASLIVLTSSTLPNAEGYYRSLEFGLTTGLTYIDFWFVR